MKKTIFKSALILLLTGHWVMLNAQKTGTIGKSTYPIYGNYLATWKSGVYILYSETDSVRIYAKIAGDTLYATNEAFRKGELKAVQNYRIAYKHPKIKISKPDKDAFYDFQIKVNSDYDDSNNKIDRYYKTHESLNDKSTTMVTYVKFTSKEKSEAFYNSLMSSAPTESSSNARSVTTSVAKEENAEIKLNIKNATADVLELFYQKAPGSKDNTSFRVQKGQSDDVKLCVGCSIFYNVKNSRGPLILTATKDMDGTTRTIK